MLLVLSVDVELIKVLFVGVLVLHGLEKLRVQADLHLVRIDEVRSHAKRRLLLILLGLAVIVDGVHDRVTANLNCALRTSEQILIGGLITFVNAVAQILLKCLQIRIER